MSVTLTLTLIPNPKQTGFVGVYVNTSNKVKPFEARVGRDGKRVYLGHFATAEEAALEVALTLTRILPLTLTLTLTLGLSLTLTLTRWRAQRRTSPRARSASLRPRRSASYWRSRPSCRSEP